MSFLQTVGIASQASDGFDRMRQNDRMNAQREQMQQRAMDDDELFREIMKRAYEFEMQDELMAEQTKAAKAKKPKLAAIPRIGEGGEPYIAPDRYKAVPEAMAEGGMVPPTNKFNGIYDDTQSGERLPTFYREWLEQGDRRGDMEAAINDIVGTTIKMANGGVVPSADDPYNGVAMYAEGGKVEQPSIWGFVKQLFAKQEAGKEPPKKRGAVEGVRGLGARKDAQIETLTADPEVEAKAQGGKIDGPGTGTSDSIPGTIDGNRPVAVSSGEYVLPAKMASAIGYDKLDAMRQKYI